MRFSSLFCALSLAVLLAACKTTGPAGEFPTPTRLPTITSLSLPSAPLHAGDSVEFSVTWKDGREPFQVAWAFDSGADVDSVAETTALRTHSATVTLVNAGATTLAATGRVTVTDAGSNAVSREFTFDVEP